jgi:uncharacterized protein YvpB
MKKLTTLVLSIVFAAFAFTSCATTNNGSERTSVTTVATTTQPAVTTQEVTTTTVVTTPPATTTTTPATTTKEASTTEKVTEVSTSAEETTIPAVEEPVEPKKVILDVTNISQYPDFPSGSSIVSAAIALNYYGFNCNAMALLNCIPIMKNPDDNGLWGNPNELFVGDPQGSTLGYGCSAVIQNTITSYLNANGSFSYTVENLTGTAFADLYSEIDKNNPVIIWVTDSFKDVKKVTLSLQSGNSFDIPYNTHTICLIGYNTENSTIIACDPMWEDSIEYPMNLVEVAYDQMGKQALVLHKK